MRAEWADMERHEARVTECMWDIMRRCGLPWRDADRLAREMPDQSGRAEQPVGSRLWDSHPRILGADDRPRSPPAVRSPGNYLRVAFRSSSSRGT